jgi:hypothetical protein
MAQEDQVLNITRMEHMDTTTKERDPQEAMEQEAAQKDKVELLAQTEQ